VGRRAAGLTEVAARDPALPPFPLRPRGPVLGEAFGASRGLRRGRGGDVMGSRPYRPGDDVRTIDWRASARLSSATGRDEFVVRELRADETPRVVIVRDRRPSMALYPGDLPWLQKPAAAAAAAQGIADSGFAIRALVGSLDFDREGEPDWVAPAGPAARWRLDDAGDLGYAAPRDALERAFDELVRHRAHVPAGSFVFVLSDFLALPGDAAWIPLLARRWDVVPVILQDPVWEASFPDLSGVVVSVASPDGRRLGPVRLTRKQARARRAANEARRGELDRALERLDLRPVVVDDHAPGAVYEAFASWADVRAALRRGVA
jgi:uncharacterized protein (DUF58 family)